jgi:hypothetical protein
MGVSVTRQRVGEFLDAAQKQFISICVSDHSGRWPTRYFERYEVVEFKHPGEKPTAVLFCSGQDFRSTIALTGIKFNKYLNIEGDLFDEIKIVSHEGAPQLSD